MKSQPTRVFTRKREIFYPVELDFFTGCQVDQAHFSVELFLLLPQFLGFFLRRGDGISQPLGISGKGDFAWPLVAGGFSGGEVI